MTWTRKKALKDVTILTVSQYTVQALVVLRGFLFGKYLGPEGFGVWASIYLFYTYGQYCHLGIYNGIIILVPGLIGAGKTEETNKYLSSAITWMNIFGALFFVSICIFVFFISSGSISSLWLPIIIVSFAVPVYFNFIFSVYRFQFEHNFKKSGIYQALVAVVDLGLSFVLLMKFGIVGAFAGMLISLLLFALLISKDGFKNLHISFDRKVLSKLLVIGFQLLLIGFTYAFLTTADKFSVASFFSKSDMGFFSMAASLAMVPYTVGLALNGVTIQRMLEEYGKTGDKHSIKLFFDESILAIAFLTPFFSVLIIAFAEPMIYILLPKYVQSLYIVEKLSLGIYFLAISLTCLSFLMVIKKYISMIVLNIILLVFAVLINFYIAKNNYGLLGVSFVTVGNYFLLSFVLYLLVYSHFYKLKKIFWMFFKLTLPIIPILAVYSVRVFVADVNLRFGIRIIVAVLWGVFAYVYLSKNTTILSQLITMMKNKFIGRIE